MHGGNMDFAELINSLYDSKTLSIIPTVCTFNLSRWCFQNFGGHQKIADYPFLSPMPEEFMGFESG